MIVIAPFRIILPPFLHLAMNKKSGLKSDSTQLEAKLLFAVRIIIIIIIITSSITSSITLIIMMMMIIVIIIISIINIINTIVIERFTTILLIQNPENQTES